jgi:hypothetical protein
VRVTSGYPLQRQIIIRGDHKLTLVYIPKEHYFTLTIYEFQCPLPRHIEEWPSAQNTSTRRWNLETTEWNIRVLPL